MTLKPILACTLGLLLLAGCSKNEPEPVKAASAPASFINKVWQVSEPKTARAGQLYVFLSEGTMVITSANNIPVLGTWKANGSNFDIVEEGRPYKVEVLSLTAEQLKVRMLSPGEPLELTFIPATS